MNTIPCRILRHMVEDSRLRPPLTEREIKLRAYILDAAERVFIRHGRAGIVLSQFSYALNVAASTIRRQFSDMDHIFALVLHQHLDNVLTAVMAVPFDQPLPELFAGRRAAYFTATRGICDVPTPMHFLLLRDRFSLPEDELDRIETKRNIIGQMIGSHMQDETLQLLDAPTLSLDMINAALKAIETVQIEQRAKLPRPASAAPETPPPEPPPRRPQRFTFRPMRRLDPALANLPDADLHDPDRCSPEPAWSAPGQDPPEPADALDWTGQDWDKPVKARDAPKTRH